MKKPVQPLANDAQTVIKNYQKEKAKKYGMDYIEPTQPKWFVSYPFMVAIMACLQVMCTMYGRKFFLFFGFNASVGWLLLLPTILYIFQIVSECYGWQYARQIVWANFIVNGIVTILSFGFKYIPFSTFNHSGLQSAYINLMDTMWVSSLTGWLLIFISDLTVSALMCWSRFQWNGRFVLVRIIILHGLSELILLAGFLITLPFNGYSLANTFEIMWQTFIARTIMSIILLPVARFIIWFIQYKVENVVVFDLHARFNPFKFGINPTDSIQFNADGWDKIDSGKINLKKMAEYYTTESLEDQHQKQMEEFNNRQK